MLRSIRNFCPKEDFFGCNPYFSRTALVFLQTTTSPGMGLPLLQDVDGHAPAPKVNGFPVSIKTKIDPAPFDGAAHIRGLGNPVARDVKHGPQRNDAGIDGNNPITCRHARCGKAIGPLARAFRPRIVGGSFHFDSFPVADGPLGRS